MKHDRNVATPLLAEDNQNPGSKRKDGHCDTQLTEIESKDSTESQQNEIYGKQKHAEIFGDSHVRMGFGVNEVRSDQALLPAVTSSTMPPTNAMPPTMGGRGMV